MSESVFFLSGYKYRLRETLWAQTRLRPKHEIARGNVILTREGLLIVLPRYSSDGPSGPTIDIKSFMPGAFIHDAGYELLAHDMFNDVPVRIMDSQLGLLLEDATHEKIRAEFDKMLYDINKQNGMFDFVNWLILKAVTLFGRSSATKPRKIHKAP